jgi:hypothetical protein
MTERHFTIPVTCCVDGQAHHVTGQSLIAGRPTGQYQALCGYLVWAAALAAPLGRPCADCTALVTTPPHPGKVSRSRHRQPRWLGRLLRRGHRTGTETRRLQRPGLDRHDPIHHQPAPACITITRL